MGELLGAPRRCKFVVGDVDLCEAVVASKSKQGAHHTYLPRYLYINTACLFYSDHSQLVYRSIMYIFNYIGQEGQLAAPHGMGRHKGIT